MQAVAITVDLHNGDADDDIVIAAEWLRDAGIAGTFFIPSTMLEKSAYRAALRRAERCGHEMASHSHQHSVREIDALLAGRPEGLGFLGESRDLHAEFFGTPPRAFRSPAWCSLGAGALDELHRLGYHADSSATPQRLGILSSTPYADVWFSSGRAPHYLRDGLLEIPTSTFLVPAGSPTFHMLREDLSALFVRALRYEAGIDPRRIIVLQFHAADFNPAGSHRGPQRQLRLVDFILCRRVGFGFKHHLRMTDARRIAAITRQVVLPLAAERCLTISGCVRLHRGESASPS